MAKRADEEERLAGGFANRPETAQIDAVGDHTDVRGCEQGGVLFGHGDDAAELGERAGFEAAPAPPVPAGGQRRPLVHNLAE